MLLHQKQKEIVQSPARFKIARAGRKGGKTLLERETLSYKATCHASDLHLTKTVFDTGRKVIYIAPTQSQARTIIWEALKTRFAKIGVPNEQQLVMKVPNLDGAWTSIYVGGWENRENYRGMSDVVHISFDEVDTLKDFFISWKEIFRPMFLDTGGTADFIGTPNNKNPNLRRLEKDSVGKPEWACFKFTSKDNPHLSQKELSELEKEYEGDRKSYQQEILAEYVDNEGSLFHFDALVDVFSNTIPKEEDVYLIVDVADDGSDKTVFSFWQGLEEYDRQEFLHMTAENAIHKIREFASKDQIPYSHIAVDAIGVGSAIASSSLLDGIVGFKSSYAPIKTDNDIVKLPNVHYVSTASFVSEFKNLRSQCVFRLAHKINNHQIASRITSDFKERVIEELALYQDESTEDGKRFATPKDRVKELLGRSPDHSDTWIMRMYFDIRGSMVPNQSPEFRRLIAEQQNTFIFNRNSREQNESY